VLFFALLLPLLAPGQAAAQPYPYPSMAQPAAPPEPPPPCTERCYTLSRLQIWGQVGKPMPFVLEGEVLAKEPYPVPLFGAPGQVRLDGVTENGGPATVGIDNDHYFLLTTARRFTLRGTITLGEDQTINVPGPLNAFDARLEQGKVIEGDHLSGLSGATLHFDPMIPESEGSKPSGPTVFQLSRALRVGAQIGFQYRLTVSAPAELGVVRLPLAHGETVQDVSGSTGWKVEAGELVMPVTGHDAQLFVNGTLPKLEPMGPDPRSAFEFFLVESGPEHRVTVERGPKQLDVKQSPIARSLPSARLYLVHRGDTLRAEARALARGEVLAAVVREHDGLVVVTARGDAVASEILRYENNGLDQLVLAPAGKPMFLAIDEDPKRILHDREGSTDLLVPLDTGTHTVRLQSILRQRVAVFGGVLAPPMPSHALTTSKQTVTLALPATVKPLALFGGDKTRWFFDGRDAVGALVGLVVGLVAFRTRRTRLLGGLALAACWFVSDALFVGAASLGLVVAGGFLASRFLRGKWLGFATAAAALAVVFSAKLVLDAGPARPDEARDAAAIASHLSLPRSYSPQGGGGASSVATPRTDGITPEGAQLAGEANGGLVGGATPIALSMPSFDYTLQASRELVTRERPFAPRLVYATSLTVGLFRFGWLALLGWLLFEHRGSLARLWQLVRERLQKRPEPPPPKPADWPQW
jgi:hypothetical protein